MDAPALYAHRFDAAERAAKARVWAVLCAEFFQRWVGPQATVLDLGAGYCEFINHIRCARKLAVDGNPEIAEYAAAGVEAHCGRADQLDWVPHGSVDVVFASNFFEHLPDKPALNRTLQQARRALKPGGRLIALGPNLKYLHGQYWDFYDHHVYLTEASLGEAMEVGGYQLELCQPKFLPFTMVDAPEYPMGFVRLYLALPLLWQVFGKQFLVIGRKPQP